MIDMHAYMTAILELLWHAGLWIIPIAIGVLLVLYVPAVRKIGMLLIILGAAGLVGFITGVADEKRQWNAAEAKTLAAEASARDDAVGAIDKSPVPGVRYDQYDRDFEGHSMLSVARDHLLRKKRYPTDGKTSPGTQPSRP